MLKPFLFASGVKQKHRHRCEPPAWLDEQHVPSLQGTPKSNPWEPWLKAWHKAHEIPILSPAAEKRYRNQDAGPCCPINPKSPLPSTAGVPDTHNNGAVSRATV